MSAATDAAAAAISLVRAAGDIADRSLMDEGERLSRSPSVQAAPPFDRRTPFCLALRLHSSAPMPVAMITRFFLYFATRDGSDAAVKILRTRGFKAEASLGWDDPFWVAVATREIGDDDLEDADKQMRALVVSLGGDYGGYDQRALPLPATT